MAENDAQRLAMVYALDVLATRFAEHEDVYVSGDLLIYYEEDNPRVSIAPDVFVVYGVAKRKRMTYLLWEELWEEGKAQEAGRSASGGPTLSSEVLELELLIDGAGELRFRDPEMGQVLLSHREEHVRANRESARAEQETARAEQEAAARRAAEARLAELLRERGGRDR